MSPGPFETKDAFIKGFIQGIVAAHDDMLTYAIMSKAVPAPENYGDSSLAGMVSYQNTSAANLSVEIGFVIILPVFQRSLIATNAVRLMIDHAFDSPCQGGFGLKRVYWQCSSANPASLGLARKMGLQQEGILRWNRLYRRGKLKAKVGNGRPLPSDSHPDDIWRDTVVLGQCWDKRLG
jgi:RimJ/RimL family protein N-acetyltransferase